MTAAGTTPATVYLVGAGPGDPGLLTVRGRELMQRADVVVYDYLASPELLALAPEGAELIDVGKQGFAEHMAQDEINSLLVVKARELSAGFAAQDAATPGGPGPAPTEQSQAERPSRGRTECAPTGESAVTGHCHPERRPKAGVEGSPAIQDGSARCIVRLKGGDPFVFGRGGEEALALAHAGVPFEVVPGVTSGIAAPAYAGIPVTQRRVASSVTFVTGHEDPTRDATSISWSALAELLQYGNTICFYMGVRNLGNISQQLISHGAAFSTPVALVRWGTTARQQSLVSNLGEVEMRAREAAFAAPAIIVVGQVASLREELAWFEKRPLLTRRIVVTRSRSQASALSERLALLGADVVEVPTIAFEEPDSYEVLDNALRNLERYQWVIFTSVNGVDAFFARLEDAEGLCSPADARCLHVARVVCIGPATRERLRGHGIVADVMPAEYRAESVFEAMREAGLEAGDHVLIARAQEAREVLPELLREAGAHVDVAATYRTVVPRDRAEKLARMLGAGDIDGVTFTSSSTVRNLIAMLGDGAVQLLQGVSLYSIGPITSQTLRDAGLEPAAQATEYTIPGLVEAILQAAGDDIVGAHFSEPAQGADGWLSDSDNQEGTMT